MKICALIPSYNHYKGVAAILERSLKAGLDILIIDDGSVEPARSALASLQDEARHIYVHRLATNGGKGAAVVVGLRLAIQMGYSHAVQIDADGQHDLEALPCLLELTRAHPEAVITGQPVYDSSVPRGRLIGRWITHIWVWIETLSFRITDSMCGFRAYPLAAVENLLSSEKIGTGMEFDTEILVRLFWRGVPPVMVPVKVFYPPENSSNFDLMRDNLRISWMHTRLFLTMVVRLTSILCHRPPRIGSPSYHWAQMRERGAWCGLKFCAFAYRLLGRTGAAIILTPTVFYFFVTGIAQRAASRDFLKRALKRLPTVAEMFRHQMNFALQAVDLLGAWMGRLSASDIMAADPAALTAASADPRGGLFIVSHLGNAEIARAVLDPAARCRVTVLAHSRNAANFNRTLHCFAPEAAANMVQVTEVGPETIIDLRQRIERGEWIVIAGDRVSVLSQERAVRVSFWGQDAAFPQGPWVLASLLECPVYLLFCVRENGCYQLTLERFAEAVTLPRGMREVTIQDCAARYAARLEYHSARAPFQWYNFYDFWGS